MLLDLFRQPPDLKLQPIFNEFRECGSFERFGHEYKLRGIVQAYWIQEFNILLLFGVIDHAFNCRAGELSEEEHRHAHEEAHKWEKTFLAGDTTSEKKIETFRQLGLASRAAIQFAEDYYRKVEEFVKRQTDDVAQIPVKQETDTHTGDPHHSNL